jgi:hypothetical protein
MRKPRFLTARQQAAQFYAAMSNSDQPIVVETRHGNLCVLILYAVGTPMEIRGYYDVDEEPEAGKVVDSAPAGRNITASLGGEVLDL